MIKSQKILGTVLLVLFFNLAAAAGGGVFYGLIKAKRDKVIALTGETLAADLKRKNIRGLDQSLNSISQEKAKVEAAFASKSDLVRFIENVERLAALSGIALEIKSAALPLDPNEKGPVFTLNVKGDFGQEFRFLTLLESANYEIVLEEARLNKSEEAGWAGQVRLKLLSYKFGK